MHHLRRAALILCLLALGSCGSAPPVQPQPAAGASTAVDASSWPAALGEVNLQVLEQPPAPLLDIALAVFESGLEDSANPPAEVFPDIRRHETRLLPARLRQVLQHSNAWGVVRLVPEAQGSTHLQLTGRILHSDGERLVLAVRAEDARGEVWLQAVYHDASDAVDYPVSAGADPFDDLYAAIANDLLAARQARSASSLQQLPQIATLRYAAGLLPAAFADFLQQDAEGHWQLRRLPAGDDPMLARIATIREREHLFVDTVDEQYLQLAESLQPAYDLWRQYTREQAEYRADYRERLAGRNRAGPPGSYAAMDQAYNAFRWSRIQEQDMEELARGFANEVRPTVLDVDGQVYRLSGSLERQYAEWRNILSQILSLEMGLPEENP